MGKFLVRKHFSLDFLGEEWKDAYLVFSAFVMSDIKDRLAKLANLEQDDSEAVMAGLTEMVSLLEEKFIEGKGVDASGKLIPVEKEDIKDLPVEVISKAVSFLSQGLSQKS